MTHQLHQLHLTPPPNQPQELPHKPLDLTLDADKDKLRLLIFQEIHTRLMSLHLWQERIKLP